MIYPVAFWPGILGIVFLVAGCFTYRHEFQASRREALGLVALGPVFVAASLAAFAGEHFSSTAGIASIVPKWIPAPLFIAYFVGVAHLAAATSFVARRCVRWSSLCLAVMFGLFVALMDLPGAFRRPELHIVWSLAARQATFAMGGLALFATVTRADQPRRAETVATIARAWTAIVLVFYGIENILFSQFAPGVPDVTPVATWIPMPSMIAYLTGGLLVAFGIAMLIGKHAAAAARWAGVLMTLLTVTLYVPQWVIARDVGQQINGINFVFDTLLFAGTMFIISRASARTARALGIAFIVCFVNACVNAGHDTAGEGSVGIERFNHALDSATRNMDNAATLALWDTDGVSLLPQTDPIVGKKAIADFLGKATAGIAVRRMEKFEMACHDIQVSGATSTEWCDELQVVQLPGGKTFDGRGRMDFVLRRRPDNSWRMVREMWQPAPAR